MGSSLKAGKSISFIKISHLNVNGHALNLAASFGQRIKKSFMNSGPQFGYITVRKIPHQENMFETTFIFNSNTSAYKKMCLHPQRQKVRYHTHQVPPPKENNITAAFHQSAFHQSTLPWLPSRCTFTLVRKR